MNYWNRKFSLHGAAIQVSCAVEQLIPQVERIFRSFTRPELPANSAMASGIIRPFEEGEVLRHLSTRARRLATSDPWLELYQDGERYWVVDERWGIAEMNLLKAQWRSWVLPNCTIDSFHLAEGAILWPMAQILRPRKLHLVPAASMVRGGWGILLLSPFSLEPELGRLIKCGWRIIGQRWTALREREGTIEMLHMPGLVEKAKPLTLRRRGTGSQIKWIDLTREIDGCGEKSALCHAVLMAEPGRRSTPRFTDLSIPQAQEALRREWPIADTHPTPRFGLLANRLAQLCRCAQVQLSHNPADLVLMLESAMKAEPQGAPRTTISLPDPQWHSTAA
jgi:hypothetical protein